MNINRESLRPSNWSGDCSPLLVEVTESWQAGRFETVAVGDLDRFWICAWPRHTARTLADEAPLIEKDLNPDN
jgi:hypothetical protein